MGFIGKAADRIRNWVRQDKESTALEFAKGAAGSGYPAQGYDMLQAYGYDVVSDYLRLEHDLLSRFVDYEEMDDYPEIAAAIDIYADDATQTDMQINRSLWVSSPDKNIEQNINRLFHKTLRLDEELWEIARTAVKYGNDYEEILVNEHGVRGLNYLPAPTVRRVEGPRGELFGFIQDFKGRTGYSPAELQQILAARAAMRQGGSIRDDKITALEDWEVVHFRLRSKQRRSIYGHSVLDSARWIWKRLMLLEDAALIYRLQRAPERYAFYVDVGDLPPREAMAFVNRVRQQFKKKKFVNPSTGKLDLKWEPLSQDDDFFVPVRKGTDSTRIEVVGSPSWQHMDDIEYFRDKLFAAMKVPKAYLGQEEGVARAVLSSEDTRFARTVLRVQRELRNGMSKVARVHMAALGVDPAKVEYEVHMTTPSSIFELAQLEVRNARADLASRMREHVSVHWVLANVFGMGDSEIETVIKQREEDMVRDLTAEGKGQAAAQKLMTPDMDMGGGSSGSGSSATREPPSGEQTPAAAAGPTVSGQEAVASMQRFHRALQSHKSPRSLLTGRVRGISEQELFRGDREAEKRAEDKMDSILRSNKIMRGRLDEVKGLVREIVRASSNNR
jgi:hypothetical protein